MKTNPITLIDGYKLDHRRQYPPGTRYVYSNLTPRASRIEGQNHVVLLGLQYFLRRYLMEEMRLGFFGRNRLEVIARYRERLDGYLGPNQIGLEHIEALHSLGYVPLRFCALPEGTPVPLRVPMLTVENTHPDFAWLPNYIETLLCNVLWLPCTSATTAWRYRQLLDHYAAMTGGDSAFVDWQGHDFSFRGLAGVEAAQLSGLGHLASFVGTDTIPALDLIDYYYGCPSSEPLGGSVPATEHSVMCAGGHDDELGTFRRLLELYPRGIVSVVSDTWDLWHVLTAILPALREQITARDGKLVIRPDSGDPVKILCGDDEAPADHPSHKGVVELLWDVFGGTHTLRGYRQLAPQIGAIYGDSAPAARGERPWCFTTGGHLMSLTLGPVGLWFTSDNHFGHANIIGYCNRPFPYVEVMDEEMVRRWNATVRPADVVVIAGDLCWRAGRPAEAIVEQLAGRKILVRGNHDKGSLSSPRFRALFEQIVDVLELKVPIGGDEYQRIVVCHYAMEVWNQSHRGAWMLHGHSHGTLPTRDTMRRLDVGADCWNFTPVGYPTIAAVMARRTFEPVDGHRARA